MNLSSSHWLSQWLSYGETGISSLALAAWIADQVPPRPNDYPYDCDDLRRCLQLLALVPTEDAARVRAAVDDLTAHDTAWRRWRHDLLGVLPL